MRSTFGSIQKMSTGRYRARWSEGGRRCSKVCASKRDAQDLLSRRQLVHAKYADYGITYSKFYSAVVVDSYKHLAERTRREYEYAWDKLAPYIADIKIADTTWHLVQDTIDKFEAAGTQRQVFVLWRKMCNLAIRDNILDKNPCDRYIKRKREPRRNKRLWDAAKLRTALDKVYDTPYAIPVLLECCAGLRHEEACAIIASDVTWRDDGYAFIRVSRALVEDNGHKLLKETKTATSERTVVLAYCFSEYLGNHSARVPTEPDVRAMPYPYGLSKRWRKFCADNGIDYMPFGNMRSVYATLCAEAGCTDSVVRQIMGHCGLSTTERYYQSATAMAAKINADGFADYLNYVFRPANL